MVLKLNDQIEARTDIECRKYYEQLQKYANKICQEAEAPFRIDFSDYILRDNFSRQIKTLLGTDDAKIWPETMAASIDMVRQMLDGKNISIIGLTQTAKTGVQVLGGLILSVVWYLKTGQWALPLFVTPVGKQFVGQFRTKMQDMLATIKDVKIVYRKKTESIGNYNNQLVYERNKIFAQKKKALTGIISTSIWNKLNSIQKNELNAGDEPLVFEIHIQYLEFFQYLFQGFHEENQKIFFIRDEGHAAVGHGSVNDRLLKSEISDGQIYKLANQEGGFLQVSLTSATMFAGVHLQQVRIPVNKNYCGLNIAFVTNDKEYEQIKVVDAKEIRPMAIMSLTEIGKVSGTDARWVRPAWYSNEEAFARYRDKNYEFARLFKNHEVYRSAVQESVAGMINHLYETAPKDGNGMLIRFVNDNPVTNDLIAAITPLIKNKVRIIRGYEESFDTVSELLEREGVLEEDACIIFVTAKGRMTESYKSRFCYGIDFTDESTTFSAIVQGILGRMSGYGKNPLVILSDKNTKRIRETVKNGNIPKGSLCKSSSLPRNRTAYRLGRQDLEQIPEMAKMFMELESYVRLQKTTIVPGSTNIFTVALGRGNHNVEICKIVKKYIPFINKNMTNLVRNSGSHSRILTLESDKYDRSEDAPKVTTRTEGSGLSEKLGGKETHKGKKIVVRLLGFHKNQKKGRISITGIDFPADDLKDHILVDACVPEKLT